jgi:hypothetical protein
MLFEPSNVVDFYPSSSSSTWIAGRGAEESMAEVPRQAKVWHSHYVVTGPLRWPWVRLSLL